MPLLVTRFAPSPNGFLHLGHALSALTAFEAARAQGGRFLLRIEDIDATRARPEFEAAIYDDLAWLGLEWERPVRRQSEHFTDYRAALERLRGAGLVYPSWASRGEIAAVIAERERDGKDWPRDPEGSPIFPGLERELTEAVRQSREEALGPPAWRLRMEEALRMAGTSLSWLEEGAGPHGERGRVPAHPERWGDVVLARKETPTSYHLAVVVDDALQGITHVVRGQDLFHATGLHRLLQRLLELPEPVYRHHRLLLGADGRKLSKSEGAPSLRALREQGVTPSDVRRMLGA